MPCNLKMNDFFPDYELIKHNGKSLEISKLTRASIQDKRLGFEDGYPVILVFYRGFFCPRDQQYMRMLIRFQEELKVNYCKLAVITVDPPKVQSAFRAGLGASWPFLFDEGGQLTRELDILDETEGEYALRPLPYTFILFPNLRVHKIYNGWFFVGRPTLEELRRDLRDIMSTLSYYSYEAYDTDHVKSIRIPQQAWESGYPTLGENGLPVKNGIVERFDLQAGYGFIKSEEGDDVFFNFTAIPGEGYRTITPGTKVNFELLETKTGLSARNIQESD